MVVACRNAARRHEADGFIGLGGGSSLDCAKGINFLLRPGGYAYVKENTIYAHNNDGLYADLGSEDSLNGCSYTQAGWERVFKDAGFGLVATDGEHGHFIFKKR